MGHHTSLDMRQGKVLIKPASCLGCSLKGLGCSEEDLCVEGRQGHSKCLRG